MRAKIPYIPGALFAGDTFRALPLRQGGADLRLFKNVIFHIPPDLVVAHWASVVANSAHLDFLLLPTLKRCVVAR